MGAFANAPKAKNSINGAESNPSPQPTVTPQPQSPQSSITELIDGAITQATNAPADPLGAAIDGFKATGTVTNSQARDILNNTKAITQLLEQTGIKLPDTASGRRAAVKQAIAQLAQQSQDGSQASIPPSGEKRYRCAECARHGSPHVSGAGLCGRLVGRTDPRHPRPTDR